MDWSNISATNLIDHILERYHAVHRAQLPGLIELASKVERVHAGHPDCPAGLSKHLTVIRDELESHMQKEEQVLFPILRRTSPNQVLGPISMMRTEHEMHCEALDKLNRITNQMSPPSDACDTWITLSKGLKQLKDDLTQHIDLENDILFMGKCLGAQTD